jgi:hypothetical protein
LQRSSVAPHPLTLGPPHAGPTCGRLQARREQVRPPLPLAPPCPWLTPLPFAPPLPPLLPRLAPACALLIARCRFLDVVLACVDSSTQVMHAAEQRKHVPRAFCRSLCPPLGATSDGSRRRRCARERCGRAPQERVRRGVQVGHVRPQPHARPPTAASVSTSARSRAGGRKVALSRGATVQLTSFDNHVRCARCRRCSLGF